MIRRTEYICVFLAGGGIYNMIELIFRGYSHWSMTIAGGACFILIHFFNHGLKRKGNFLRCVIGGVLITAVELTVGIVVNLVLKLDVWDYSHMYGNFLGQICPLFSVLWFFLTYPACLMSNIIRKFFDSIRQSEEIPI